MCRSVQRSLLHYLLNLLSWPTDSTEEGSIAVETRI